MVTQPIVEVISTETKLMTAEEFWAMPKEAGKRYELVRGMVIEMPGGAGGKHTIVALRAGRYVGAFADDNDLGYTTGADGAYYLSRNPDVMRMPDVGFVAKARMPRPVTSKFIPVAPDLVVEVVSPGDTASEIREKVGEYLQYGVRMIWVIYPELQTADVYLSSNQIYSVSVEGVLEGGEVLPGFSLPLKTLFVNLDA